MIFHLLVARDMFIPALQTHRRKRTSNLKVFQVNSSFLHLETMTLSVSKKYCLHVTHVDCIDLTLEPEIAANMFENIRLYCERRNLSTLASSKHLSSEGKDPRSSALLTSLVTTT